MTWTYTTSLAADKDKVRFLSGDVVSTDPLRSDEEIAGVLTMESNVYRAASMICDSLASQFSREADQAIDDMRRSKSQRAKAFADRALRLSQRADSTTGSGEVVPVPFAGGISVADKDTRSSDTDRVPPFFTREDMDFGTLTPDTDD